MAIKPEEIVSAQVVLRAANGKAPDAYVTAETLNQYLPSPEMAAQARAAYAGAGFEVGPLVANNFPITAPARTFERVFQAKLRRTARGGIHCVSADGSIQADLSLQAADKDLSLHVAAVTFPAPPDFGPTQFSY